MNDTFLALLSLRYTALEGFGLLILKYVLPNIKSITKKTHIMTSGFSNSNTLKTCHEDKMMTSQLNLTEIFKSNMNYYKLHKTKDLAN